MPGYFYTVTTLKNNGLPDLERAKMGHTESKVPEKYIYDNYARTMEPLHVLDIIPCVDSHVSEQFIFCALQQYRITKNNENISEKNEIFDITSDESRDIYNKAVDMIKSLNDISKGSMPERTIIDYNEWLKNKNKKIDKKNKLEKFIRDNIEINEESFLTFTDIVDKFKMSSEYSTYQIKNIQSIILSIFNINYYHEKYYHGKMRKDVYDNLKFKNSVGNKKYDNHINKELMSFIEEKYVITGNDNDFVPYADIEDFIINVKMMQISDKKLQRELTTLGFKSKEKRINGNKNKTNLRTGILSI